MISEDLSQPPWFCKIIHTNWKQRSWEQALLTHQYFHNSAKTTQRTYLTVSLVVTSSSFIKRKHETDPVYILGTCCLLPLRDKIQPSLLSCKISCSRSYVLNLFSHKTTLKILIIHTFQAKHHLRDFVEPHPWSGKWLSLLSGWFVDKIRKG